MHIRAELVPWRAFAPASAGALLIACLILASRVSHAAPAPPAAPEVGISVAVGAFSVQSAGPFKAGDVVSATLHGSPGGKASFFLPNIAENVPMREVSPGVYTGRYTVAKDVNVAGAAVVGQLIGADGTAAPLLQAPTPITIDNAPPEISDMSPTDNATIETASPSLWAALDDGVGAGVDPASVRIVLDGLDITALAAVTPHSVFWRPGAPLSPGKHVVQVQAADRLGNRSQRSWAFTVESGPGLVSSLTSNLAGASVQVKESHPLVLTLSAAPSGRAAFDIGPVARAIPMKEVAPGAYRGIFSPEPGQSVQNAPVVVRFTAPGGAAATTDLGQAVTLAAGSPAKPSIVKPGDGDPVQGPQVVMGTAPPYATVHVTISYFSRDIAGPFEIQGNAVTLCVRADAKGHWKTPEVGLATPSLLGPGQTTRYTVAAVTVDAVGDESEPFSIDMLPG